MLRKPVANRDSPNTTESTHKPPSPADVPATTTTPVRRKPLRLSSILTHDDHIATSDHSAAELRSRTSGETSSINRKPVSSLDAAIASPTSPPESSTTRLGNADISSTRRKPVSSTAAVDESVALLPSDLIVVWASGEGLGLPSSFFFASRGKGLLSAS